MSDRTRLLRIWADRLNAAAHHGHLGKNVGIAQIKAISGPRVGALHILLNTLTADAFISALSSQNYARLRQLVPWTFRGDPVAFMYGQHVRVEAGWSDALAFTDLPLDQIQGHTPKGRGMWAFGCDEYGSVICGAVSSDHVAHWLMAGMTGMGKTVTVQSVAVQLALDPTVRLVLVDGKLGASFRYPSSDGGRQLFHLRNQIGPVAITPEQWRGALVWAVNDMSSRYAAGTFDTDTKLVVMVDEVQEVIQDGVAREAFRRLVTMGRDASVHVIAATQHPVVKSLGGPTVTRAFAGRLALRVNDWSAAQVALGDPPLPAHKLQHRGDAYVKTTQVFRIQVAYATAGHFEKATGSYAGFHVPAWEDATAEDLGMEPAKSGRRSPWPSDVEMGAALMTAAQPGAGRGTYQDAVEEETDRRPGGSRAGRTLTLAREVLGWLQEKGLSLAGQAEEPSKPKVVWQPSGESAPDGSIIMLPAPTA